MKKYVFSRLLLCGLTCSFLLCGCSGESQSNTKEDEKTYTISFDLNGGEGEVPSFKVKEGERIKIPNEIPTISHGEFSSWSLKTGKARIDQDLEYIDGEEEAWYETYLGRDEGPYLAYSDLVFSADYSMEKKELEFWAFVSSSQYRDYNIEENVANSTPNDDYYDSINVSLMGDPESQLYNSEAVRQLPEFAILSYYSYLGEEINPKADVMEAANKKYKDLLAPLNNEANEYLVNNFSGDQKDLIMQNNFGYGLPLFSYDYNWYNASTDERDIPMRAYYYVCLLRPRNYNNWIEMYPSKYEFACKFAINLSKCYLNK